MAPEMAAAYVVGWVPSLAVTGLHFYLQRKRYQSISYNLVQENLRQVNMIWNDTESRLQGWSDDGPAKDLAAAKRTIFLMGTFSFFLSWAGMFFHLMIVFSLHVFAISRLEKAVFTSRLSQKPLSLHEIQAELADLKDRGLISL